MLPELAYYIISAVLILLVMLGILLLGKVPTARLGNGIIAIAMFLAIALTVLQYELITPLALLIIILVGLLIGTVIGIYLAIKVKMIQMPEMVALLNGLGGAASAIIGASNLYLSNIGNFEIVTSILAVIIGVITLVGSLIAAGKLAKFINGKPIIYKGHSFWLFLSGIILIALFIIMVIDLTMMPLTLTVVLLTVFCTIFGYLFAIRVGGADMPVTISLLNSLSGVAGAIAGMAVGDILLVSIGAIVGSSGLVLTQIMGKAMNRPIIDILMGATSVSHKESSKDEPVEIPSIPSKEEEVEEVEVKDPIELLKLAKKVIIVPGYGMALAQAQHLVKSLSDWLENNGASVKFAIHPVAGRMPGHMNVLLAEADIDYDHLYEMSDINDEFKETDVAIVVGANDVLNPAAREAEGTPIYGMPILNVDQAKHVIFCNYDLKPGYAGVENPLYHRQTGVTLLLGNASETLVDLLGKLNENK